MRKHSLNWAGGQEMSIDGRIRRVLPHEDGLLLEIMPRGMSADAGYAWSCTGQDSLILEHPYTHKPEPGEIIWGNSGEVIIGKQPNHRSYWRGKNHRRLEPAAHHATAPSHGEKRDVV